MDKALKLKILLILLFLCACFSLKAFDKDVLQKWQADLTNQERSEFADDIVFEYKYTSKHQQDSILSILYEFANSSSKDILAWTKYIHSGFENGNANYLQAISHLENGLLSTSDDYINVKLNTKLAQTYTTSNQLDNAANSFTIAIDAGKKLDNPILICEIFASLGEFHRKAGQFKTGLKYLDSAQTLVNENQIFSVVNIDILDRKAAIYSQVGRPDSLKRCSYAALALAYEMENAHAQAVSHNELGYFYEHAPNFDSAYYHYNEAIRIWKELEAYRYLANAQFNKARLCLKDNKMDVAKNLLFETEKICQGKNWLEIYPRLYEHIMIIYGEEGDSVNYYKYAEKRTHAHYQLYVSKNNRELFNIEHQLQLNESNETIEKQKDELAVSESLLNEKENDKGKLLIYLIVSSGMLVATIALLILGRKKRKKLSSNSNG